MKFDTVAAEAQILVEEFPQVKDHPGYADCVYSQIKSHWKRRDKSQFLKALQAHQQIDLVQVASNDLIKATYDNTPIILKRYIFLAFSCFDL